MNYKPLIFSFRSDDDLLKLHDSGLHCVPHIGVYGEEYSIALPLMLVSLNPSLSILSQLPSSVLAALQINIQDESDAIFRKTARSLVSRVIESACKHIEHFDKWRLHKPSIPDGKTEANNSITFVLSGDHDDDFQIMPPLVDCIHDELLLRKIAQKLVRKVLHSACTLLEPLSLSTSMEELVTNTKKLKISVSPCHTPPLHFEEFNEPACSEENKCDVNDSVLPANDKTCFSVGSCNLGANDLFLKKLGKKRQRSASHEANMEKDLEKLNIAFNSKLQLSHATDSVKHSDEDKTMARKDTATPFGSHLSFNRPIASMIADIRKMSIMEADENETDESSEEEEGVICLPAITRPPTIIEDDEEEQNNNNSYSMDLNDRKLSLPHHHDEPLVQNLDYYIIIHSCPPSGECQKFLCQNTNEVNLIFHCWLYKHVPFHPTISVVEQLEMGIFEPEDVVPVHLDLVDAGIPFSYLEPRSVCIHNLCFSPENAQLQLPDTSNSTRSFYSIGSHHDRKVLTFHVLPTSKCVEQELHLLLRNCDNNLSEFLLSFSHLQSFHHVGKTFHHLLHPIL